MAIFYIPKLTLVCCQVRYSTLGLWS